MRQDDEIATFQARLLDLLHQHDDARLIQDTLIAEFGDGQFAEFVRQMQPRMTEVGAHLVKKWGVRERHDGMPPAI